MLSAEKLRLIEDRDKQKDWRKFGPYLTERQWGTVREDYTEYGDAWNAISHDAARSRAYRWGEEGIGGISDDKQNLCFAVSLWNKKDTILKERLFGLTNGEGNHGEDCKDQYYYLDNVPTHAYMKMLYKYPQQPFPYDQLVAENRRRGRHEPEFDLIDTGIFDDDQYFDVFIEYAKADTDDILIRITAENRGKLAAPLHILPTIWFKNTWAWGYDAYKPEIFHDEKGTLTITHRNLGQYHLFYAGNADALFCENNTNTVRFTGTPSSGTFKDGINDHVVDGKKDVLNKNHKGTKAALNYETVVPGRGKTTFTLRLSPKYLRDPFADFDKIFNKRLAEADEFYTEVHRNIDDEDLHRIQRQAIAGMLWSKQYYHYNVAHWLKGDPALPKPADSRRTGRNHNWTHLRNDDIISMPDKWEYPWYAAWDLAFHTIPLAIVDPEFAKRQLLMLTKEWYMHPNGQLPAYEWHLDGVNPPVHAWAAWRVYKIDSKLQNGVYDRKFLEEIFHKLLLNFTWWVNKTDKNGNNIFQGGFLGMDNIGVFDRSSELPTGGYIEQSDGSAWMAMFTLNMLRISLELSKENPTYQSLATKFFEHFLYIAGAITNVNNEGITLWDEEDEFYYDVLNLPDRGRVKMKVRSMVGLIPLFAVEVLDPEVFEQLPEFSERLKWFLTNRPELANLISRWEVEGKGQRHLLSLLRGHRMKAILKRMLDESEFLSPYGIRALSRYHLLRPYVLYEKDAEFSVKYVPGEADNGMFGGNSNWRGPVWFPTNFLIIESLQRFHHYYGDDFLIEYPTGSGKKHTLKEIATDLSDRLIRIFQKDERGYRPTFGGNKKMQTDPHFNNYVLFYEYFHGDNGSGLGAGHQTGWTGLVAKLISRL
jgi:hypothetical protein